MFCRCLLTVKMLMERRSAINQRRLEWLKANSGK